MDVAQWPQWLKTEAGRAASLPVLSSLVAMGTFPELGWRVLYASGLTWFGSRFTSFKALEKFGHASLGLQLSTMIGLHPDIAAGMLSLQADATLLGLGAAGAMAAARTVRRGRGLPTGFERAEVLSGADVTLRGVVDGTPVGALVNALHASTEVGRAGATVPWGVFELGYKLRGPQQVSRVSSRGVEQKAHEAAVELVADYHVQDVRTGEVQKVRLEPRSVALAAAADGGLFDAPTPSYDVDELVDAIESGLDGSAKHVRIPEALGPLLDTELWAATPDAAIPAVVSDADRRTVEFAADRLKQAQYLPTFHTASSNSAGLWSNVRIMRDSVEYTAV